MPRLRRPSHSMVVAYLALFVALGGSSYAAAKITGKQVRDSSLTGADVRNSSLTSSDIRDRTLLSSDFKLGQLPAGAKGAAGSAGAGGAQGAPGAKGDTGAPGATGPTAAAVGNSIDPLSTPDALMANTGVTSLVTPGAGNVLGFGQLTLGIKCPATATISCSFTAGLYLDGNPIPDSGFATSIVPNGQPSFNLDLFGLIKGVPAGTHSITVGWKSGAAPNNAAWFSQSNQRSSGLFVGG